MTESDEKRLAEVRRVCRRDPKYTTTGFLLRLLDAALARVGVLEEAADNLNRAADTAELLIRQNYPARAQSLHKLVGEMKALLDAAALTPPAYPPEQPL